MTRDEVIAALCERGAGRDRATIYADAYLAYREAAANIQDYGVIVQHPRTGNPVANPYLEIRERAARRLESMRKLRGDFLW